MIHLDTSFLIHAREAGRACALQLHERHAVTATVAVPAMGARRAARQPAPG